MTSGLGSAANSIRAPIQYPGPGRPGAQSSPIDFVIPAFPRSRRNPRLALCACEEKQNKAYQFACVRSAGMKKDAPT